MDILFYIFIELYIYNLFSFRKKFYNHVWQKNSSKTFIFEDFIYLFLERREGKEKERERNISVWLPLTHPLLGTWPATPA